MLKDNVLEPLTSPEGEIEHTYNYAILTQIGPALILILDTLNLLSRGVNTPYECSLELNTRILGDKNFVTNDLRLTGAPPSRADDCFTNMLRNSHLLFQY